MSDDVAAASGRPGSEVLDGPAHEFENAVSTGVLDWLFVDGPEASSKVDIARRGKRVIAPQAPAGIANRRRELKRTVEQSAAETMTVAVGMNEQDSQLRRAGMVGVGDAEDAPNAPAVDLSDPRCLSPAVAISGRSQRRSVRPTPQKIVSHPNSAA